MSTQTQTLRQRSGGSILDALRTSFSRHRWLYLMLLPAITYVVIFNYIPMTGLVLAFKNYTYSGGIYHSPWNGLNNFKFLIISRKLWPLTRNTLLYNTAFIVVGMTLEVGFAVFISELGSKVFKRAFQSIIFLPFFMSWVIVATIAHSMFSYEFGFINKILETLGATRVNIYEHPGVWPFIIVAFRTWKTTGYGTIIYLATITSIDPEMYEAATIDGANIWKRNRYITFPHLVPTMIILFLLAVGQIFRGEFGLFYQLIGNNGQLLQVGDILDLFVYRALTSTSDIGMAAAAGFYQSVLCFATVTTVNGIIKRIQPDYSLY